MTQVTEVHGLAIEFGTTTNDYGKNITVDWYVDSTVVSSRTFVADNPIFFCDNNEVYNKIVITISTTNNPYRFLKILNISDGISREFYNEEIQNAEIIEQVNPNNQSLSINQLNMILVPQSLVGVSFQKLIPFRIYRNNVFFGTFFVQEVQSNHERTIFKLTAQDYVSLLNERTHLGGMYSAKSVSDLVLELMGDIPYELDANLAAKTVSGYLPIQSSRESLRMLMLAIGGIVDTSRFDKVLLKELSQTSTSTIGKDRIIGIEETEIPIITKCRLIKSKYTDPAWLTPKEELFSGDVTSRLTVYFDKPMTRISLYDGESTIIHRDANYMIIGIGNDNVITGYPYKETAEISERTNIYSAVSDEENIVEIQTALTCDGENLLDNYHFIKANVKATFKMQNELVGDLVTLDGKLCRILSLNYNIAQGNIYATAELEEYYG